MVMGSAAVIAGNVKEDVRNPALMPLDGVGAIVRHFNKSPGPAAALSEVLSASLQQMNINNDPYQDKCNQVIEQQYENLVALEENAEGSLEFSLQALENARSDSETLRLYEKAIHRVASLRTFEDSLGVIRMQQSQRMLKEEIAKLRYVQSFEGLDEDLALIVQEALEQAQISLEMFSSSPSDQAISNTDGSDEVAGE